MSNENMPVPAGEMVPASPTPIGTALVPALDSAAQLLAAFLAGRSPETVRAYRKDVEDFAAFVGVPTPTAAATLLLSRGHGSANALALAYRAHLLERQLAPATVNRRLAALRSLVQLGRTLGMVSWSLECAGVRAEAYRDTRGPGTRGFRKLLKELDRQQGRKAVRDRAIVRLLFDLGLRRVEVCRLDLADLDLAEDTLAVRGKGRGEKTRLTLPGPTRQALEAWAVVRGDEPGPLFLNCDRARKGDGRLTGAGLYYLVRRLGDNAGVRARPHGLRHAAITAALDLTRGDIRAVQKFARHKDVRVLERYDDNRSDMAGEVARKVAGAGEG